MPHVLSNRLLHNKGYAQLDMPFFVHSTQLHIYTHVVLCLLCIQGVTKSVQMQSSTQPWKRAWSQKAALYHADLAC